MRPQLAQTALLAVVLNLVMAAAVSAQSAVTPAVNASQPVTDGYHISPPFVMHDGEGPLGGMAIELWEGGFLDTLENAYFGDER
jgi:hypothetical protein